VFDLRFHPGIAGASRLRLRAPAGRDELTVSPDDLRSFYDFIEALVLTPDAGFLDSGHVRNLAVCDLEVVAAMLQRQFYGERIESSLTCTHCGRDFELAFDLNELLASRFERRADNVIGPDAQGNFTLGDGRQFRLPTGVDELAVANLEPDDAAAELRSRCVVQGAFDDDTETLEAALEAAGPLLSRDIHAHCPHCQREQAAHFQMRHYFLASLNAEKRLLNHEVHHLARAYGWSRTEILEMTRDERRLHVKLVLP
jgi:hypothetical protein